MKIATAAYPLDWFSRWEDYEEKLARWVDDAAGADLLVFPEYGAMELASLAGDEIVGDLQAASRAVEARMADAAALHSDLARRRGMHILQASGPVAEDGRVVNRAFLHTPDGHSAYQDKLIMTLWERDPWAIEGHGPLRVFETTLGRIAINICYDSEFPLLARAQSEAELLLVPSCTEALEGYWRVRIGAQARALEGQCVSVMSSVVGAFPQVDAVEISRGAGGIFCPPDMGFPPNGVIAEGILDQPGWTIAEVDLEAVRAVRTSGNVRNRDHWAERDPAPEVELLDLR